VEGLNASLEAFRETRQFVNGGDGNAGIRDTASSGAGRDDLYTSLM